MANAQERILKILLKLSADASGGPPIRAELKAVQAQAVQTAAALKTASTSGGLDPETAKRESEFAARIAARRLATEQAILETQKQAAAVIQNNNVVAGQGAAVTGSGLGVGNTLLIGSGQLSALPVAFRLSR